MASVSSVVKLSGTRRKPWWARKTVGYKANGHPIYLTVGYFKTRQEGIAELTKLYNNPGIAKNYNLTVKDIYGMFKRTWSQKVNFGPKSEQAYEVSYEHISDLHYMKMREIKHTEIQPIIDKGFKDKAGAAKKIKMLYSQLCKVAMSMDLMDKNYSQFIILPGSKPKVTRRIFTDEEIQWLFDNVSNYKSAMHILIMIYTGMRISEVIELDLANIFFDKRYMIGGTKTEAGKDRIIPISRKIEPFLRQLCRESKVGLLVNDNGERMKYSEFVNNHFKPLMAAMESEHTTHDCRHTAVSLMRQAGVDRLHIKLIVGHKISDITDKVYTHIAPEVLVAEIDKL